MHHIDSRSVQSHTNKLRAMAIRGIRLATEQANGQALCERVQEPFNPPLKEGPGLNPLVDHVPILVARHVFWPPAKGVTHENVFDPGGLERPFQRLTAEVRIELRLRA